MKLRWVVLGVGTLILPACATVSVTDVNGANAVSSVASQKTTNVVVKASEKLTQEFSANGWVEPSNYNLKTAAMTLLKGNTAVKSPDEIDAYAATVTPAALKADISKAGLLANQTLKAADVYLEYAEADEDMTEELQSLETALLTCRKAERTFTIASQLKSVEAKSELAMMSATVDQLQDTTDDYGRQVRASKIYTDYSKVPVN